MQWFLPDSQLLLFRGSREAPPVRFVISDENWGKQHRAARAQLLWRDNGRDQALWHLQRGCPDADC